MTSVTILTFWGSREKFLINHNDDDKIWNSSQTPIKKTLADNLFLGIGNVHSRYSDVLVFSKIK